MGKFTSTKLYDHNEGLSCMFRQPKATHSHCSLLHGYALSFKFTFECLDLDDKNWVQDYGGLKPLKQWLHDTFDHTWAVDEDDPLLPEIQQFVNDTKIANLKIMNGVGCEMFAKHAYEFAENLVKILSNGRIHVLSVEVREHAANSSTYSRESIFT